jgi:hypothetical protein
MTEITITYECGVWSTNADQPITLEDEIILFTNEADVPCQITFQDAAAFGIMGIVLAPESGFTLVFRGVATRFRLSDLTFGDEDTTHNPTIPPG